MNRCSATITGNLLRVFETGTSHELTHNRRGWYLLVADGQEEVDELQQAVRLSVFWTVPGHRGEDDFGMSAQHGKLDVEG